MLGVIFYLCCIGLVLTLSLAGPIFVALLVDELEIAKRLLLHFLLGGFLFAGPVIAIRQRIGRVPKIGGLFLVVLIWLVMPFFAALPMADITELSWIDASFEAVSGLTTTGSTTIQSIEAWPQSMLFWRAQLQWIGGLMALLTVFSFIAPLGIGGLSLNAAASSGSLNTSIVARSRLETLLLRFGLAYLLTTIFAFFCFLTLDVRSFYAAGLAMASVSTGGFLPFSAPLEETVGTTGLFFFAVFLGVGATSVFWHRMILKMNTDRLKEHRESYSVLILLGVLGLILAQRLISVSGDGGANADNLLIEGLMNSASLVATSGVESRPGVFSLLPLPLILFVVLLGGSAFSTSGGLKHYRAGGMMIQSWSELDRLIYPHAVRPSRFGSQYYDLQLMKAIWSFFVVAILTISLGTLFIAASEVPFEAALTATISSFATAGPVYTSGWEQPGTQPWPAFGDYSVSGKMTLMAIMLLGRLEVLTVLGLFSSHYWRNR